MSRIVARALTISVVGLLLALGVVETGGEAAQLHAVDNPTLGPIVHDAPLQTRVKAVPRLGISWAKWITGFGSVKPTKFSFAIDGYSQVTGIKWASWGGPMATGTGIGWYEPAGAPSADGRSEAVKILAFDLGTCRGAPAYTAIDWYFPGEGETQQISPHLDICLGDTVQQGCDPFALAAAIGSHNHSVGGIATRTQLTGAYCRGTDAVAAFETVDGQMGAEVILKDSGRKWHVVFEGSDLPPGTRTGIALNVLTSMYKALWSNPEPWFWPVPIP